MIIDQSRLLRAEYDDFLEETDHFPGRRGAAVVIVSRARSEGFHFL